MANKILIVDDEELIRWSLGEDLERAGYKTAAAADLASARQLMEKEPFDAVLTDLRLGADCGLDVLREARKLCPGAPVVLMTGFADFSSAVEALREGAADYISKPLQLAALKITLQRVLETATLKRRLDKAHEKKRERYSLDRLVCASAPMREAVAMARKIAASPTGTVLILGESGCGKDRIARAIHYESARASQPMMEINCTAIPETLLESELFGYEKGAFTDARQQKKGLLELCNHGTVFLNEIGHMSPALQAKLLHFLEEKTFRRVGGGDDIVVDVRVIAATNEDLERAISEKRFRTDLYYRLNVLTVRLLPLRQRRDDIAPLIDVLLGDLCRELRKPRPAFPERTLAAMREYAWPGNVRELRNALERMLILGETEFTPIGAPPGAPKPAAEGSADFALPASGVRLEDVEKSFVEQAMKAAGGNQQKAAALLGLSRDALRRRLEKFGLRTGAAPLLCAALALWAAGARAKDAPVDPFLAAHPKEAAAMRADPVVHAPVSAGQCSACHASPRDPARLAGELKALCLSCHPNSRAELAKPDVHAPYKETDCTTCHQPHSSRQPRLLVDEPGALCAACHKADEEPMRGAHAGVTAFAGSCTRCHAPHGSANKKLLREAGLHVPFSAGACGKCHDQAGADGKPALKPLASACLSCHQATAQAGLKAAVHPPFGQSRCESCHDPHASPEPALLRRPLNETCRSCHPGVPETGHPVAQHPTLVRGKLDCDGCHLPHGAPWPQLLKETPQKLCRACHPQI